MIDYSWIFRVLVDVEEFANLNRLYGLRDRVSLACDALTEDVERLSKLEVQMQSQSKAKEVCGLNMHFGNVLLFPKTDRRTDSSPARPSSPIRQ